MLITGTAQYFFVYQGVSLSTIHTQRRATSRCLARAKAIKHDVYGAIIFFVQTGQKLQKKPHLPLFWLIPSKSVLYLPIHNNLEE